MSTIDALPEPAARLLRHLLAPAEADLQAQQDVRERRGSA